MRDGYEGRGRKDRAATTRSPPRLRGARAVDDVGRGEGAGEARKGGVAPSPFAPSLTCVAHALLMTWLAKKRRGGGGDITWRPSFSAAAVHLKRKMRP